jgi:hypothetical protein
MEKKEIIPCRSPDELLYIHLNGRGELGAKIERGMASIHTWRVDALAEALR